MTLRSPNPKKEKRNKKKFGLVFGLIVKKETSLQRDFS